MAEQHEPPRVGKQVGFKTVQLLKAETLGIGSYGSVCKAKCDNLLCAAKILHPALVEPNTHQVITKEREHRLPMKRFEQECEFMSAINHPNIVQYLGMYQDPKTDLPVLLMELMDDSLTHFLESSQEAVPYHIQVNFCHDIILALSFLHSNGITHRDLSSNNVLLRGNVFAKVTDFGMAKLSDTSPERIRSFTLCPGTDSFMPPEAAKNVPEYTEKIDCFSFGVLVVQILSKKFPDPSDRHKEICTTDPQFPSGTVEIRVPEVERRQAHINDIDENNPLLAIALECLKDRDTERPSSQDLCDQVAALKETAEYAESVRSVEEREDRLREELQQQHTAEINDLKEEHATEINDLKEEHTAEISDLKEEHATEISDLKEEHATEISDLKEEHTAEVNDIKVGHDKQIEEKDDTISMQQEEILQRTREKLQLKEQLRAKDEEISRIQEEHLQELQIKVQAVDAEKRRNHELTQLLAQSMDQEQHLATEIQELQIHYDKCIKERDETISARTLENQHLREDIQKQQQHASQLRIQYYKSRTKMPLAPLLHAQCPKVDPVKIQWGLNQLIETLSSVSKKWYQLGLNLGLSSTELHEFDKLDGSTEDRQVAMLKALLEKENGTITVAKLVEALRKIEEVELAEKLEEQNARFQYINDGTNDVPDYKTQKTEIHAVLQQRLKKGDTWYLVDVKWMKQWKKYVGYDQWDQSSAGQETAIPGPLDNSNLFKNSETKNLKERLMEELDYYLLPEGAWNKLVAWYGLTQDSRPILRRVVEHGLYMKHCKVEVYLLEFKLCLHPHVNETHTKPFSRADTVADLEAVLKKEFNISEAAECRVWHRYMTHTYELLSTPTQALQDAGLYNGQTIVLEKKNEDGSWPRQSQKSSLHPTRSSDDTFSSASSTTSSASNSTSCSTSSHYSYFSPSQKSSSGQYPKRSHK